MMDLRTYVISFFILTSLYFVTGYDGINHKTEDYFSGPRIVGGSEALPEKLPYQVAIYSKPREDHHCGGSIIDSDHVLTAAHCIYHKQPDGFSIGRLNPTDLLIFAGVLNNTKESSEVNKVVREVTEVFIHEGYNYDSDINDIAILKVSPGFPTDNPAVKPIPLRKDVAPNGAKCFVSGWGHLGEPEETYPQILQVAVVHFMNFEECRSKYRNYTELNIEPGMICAANINGGKHACEGDSGGPLQCDDLLTGIVSTGAGCALPNCPGVYTDVAYYKEWIERQLLKSKDEL